MTSVTYPYYQDELTIETWLVLVIIYRGADPKCTGSFSKLLNKPVHLGFAPLY